MVTTLKDLVDSAKAEFPGVKYTDLWVFYDEVCGEFYFMLNPSTSASSLHNILSNILDCCQIGFKDVSHDKLMVVWNGLSICVKMIGEK